MTDDELARLQPTNLGVAVDALLAERDALLAENHRLRERLRAFDAKVCELRAQVREGVDLVKTSHFFVHAGLPLDPVARIWLEQSIAWLAATDTKNES